MATRELQRFTSLIHSHNPEKPTTFEEGEALSGWWQGDEGRFLVIANSRPEKHRFTDADVLAALNDGKVQAWDFTRETALELNEGRVAGINLEPWEVLVWQVK